MFRLTVAASLAALLSVLALAPCGLCAAETPGALVQPVPPDAFVEKVCALLGDIHRIIAGIIVPLGGIAMVVSVGAFMVGWFTGWGAVKRFGFGGMLATCCGFLLFWGIPVILGLLQALGKNFAS